MTVAPAEVVRHFLKLEATRFQYSGRKDEFLFWCRLPDSKMIEKTKSFAEERKKDKEENPALDYLVGGRSEKVTSWSRERIKCSDIFTCGISERMLCDIDSVKGNIVEFANKFAKKYTNEFLPLAPLCELTKFIMVVAHQMDGKEGKYEVIDGAHRLVALCRDGTSEVDAYVAQIK